MIDEEFVKSLPDDPVDALQILTERFRSFRQSKARKSGMIDSSSFEVYLSYYALVTTLAERADNESIVLGNLNLDIDKEKIIFRIVKQMNDLHSVLGPLRAKIQLARRSSEFRQLLGGHVYFEFSEHDLQRIQEIINELRDFLTKTEQLEEDHKSRILRRLEALQSEIHKKVSDLDRLWGLIGDAGVVLGKLGDDAKPFVDRIRELSGIAWRTQSQTEKLLPSDAGPPLLIDESKS